MDTDLHTNISRRLALLPDEKLMHLLHALKQSSTPDPHAESSPRGDRVEVICRELRARGIFGPPWWSGTGA